MKNIKVLAIICLFLTADQLMAQHYKLAAGLRIGDNYGLSLQGKIVNHTSAEFILHPGLGEKLNSFTFVLKQHQKIISDRINIYAGGGLYQSWKNQNAEFKDNIRTGGIQTMIGAELTIGRYNISWDFSPGLAVWGDHKGSFTGGSAVSIRYVLIKQPNKKFNLKFWEKSK